MESFDLDKHTKDLHMLVEGELLRALPPSSPAVLHKAMAYSLVSGGKRLRPILCLTSTMVSGGDLATAMPTAIALEMLHAATLIHDDLPIMDDAELRRGKPSNHVVFGPAMALLAGDALLAYSIEHIVTKTDGVDDSVLLAVVSKLVHVVGASGLAGGQALDIECQGAPTVELETLEAMHVRKTGALIEAAIVTGAMLGGAPEEELRCLSRYATNLGLAYQIIDDILDEVAAADEIGKSPGRDQSLGKWTFPRLLGLSGARERALEVTRAAKEHLAPLGPRAEPFLAIADFAYERRS